ncbi:unnamed protein product, partial [Prorocentrum cordatum]
MALARRSERAGAQSHPGLGPPKDAGVLLERLRRLEAKVIANHAEFIEHRSETEHALQTLLRAQRDRDAAERAATAHQALCAEDLEARLSRAAQLARGVYDQQLELQADTDGRLRQLQQEVSSLQPAAEAFVAPRSSASGLQVFELVDACGRAWLERAAALLLEARRELREELDAACQGRDGGLSDAVAAELRQMLEDVRQAAEVHRARVRDEVSDTVTRALEGAIADAREQLQHEAAAQRRHSESAVEAALAEAAAQLDASLDGRLEAVQAAARAHDRVHADASLPDAPTSARAVEEVRSAAARALASCDAALGGFGVVQRELLDELRTCAEEQRGRIRVAEGEVAVSVQRAQRLSEEAASWGASAREEAAAARRCAEASARLEGGSAAALKGASLAAVQAARWSASARRDAAAAREGGEVSVCAPLGELAAAESAKLQEAAGLAREEIAAGISQLAEAMVDAHTQMQHEAAAQRCHSESAVEAAAAEAAARLDALFGRRLEALEVAAQQRDRVHTDAAATSAQTVSEVRSEAGRALVSSGAALGGLGAVQRELLDELRACADEQRSRLGASCAEAVGLLSEEATSWGASAREEAAAARGSAEASARLEGESAAALRRASRAAEEVAGWGASARLEAAAWREAEAVVGSAAGLAREEVAAGISELASSSARLCAGLREQAAEEAAQHSEALGRAARSSCAEIGGHVRAELEGEEAAGRRTDAALRSEEQTRRIVAQELRARARQARAVGKAVARHELDDATHEDLCAGLAAAGLEQAPGAPAAAGQAVLERVAQARWLLRSLRSEVAQELAAGEARGLIRQEARDAARACADQRLEALQRRVSEALAEHEARLRLELAARGAEVAEALRRVAGRDDALRADLAELRAASSARLGALRGELEELGRRLSREAGRLEEAAAAGAGRAMEAAMEGVAHSVALQLHARGAQVPRAAGASAADGAAGGLADVR